MFDSPILPAPRNSVGNQQKGDRVDSAYLPAPLVWKRYGITPMTGWRWERDPDIDFPLPMVVNRRKFYLVSDLEAWERRRVRGTGHSGREQPAPEQVERRDPVSGRRIASDPTA
jgi:hypothetical protein